MNKAILGGLAAMLLICGSAPSDAASARPGSVDPAPADSSTSAPSGPTPVTSTDGHTLTPADKNARKAKVRKHRSARRYARPLFYIPPPQLWFRTNWPRYRYHRGQRRYYAGAPFSFYFRW